MQAGRLPGTHDGGALWWSRRRLLLLLLIPVANANRAPDVAPVITRKDWCVHGTPTRTTGECMCRWSNKDACQGPAYRYEYGLSWHHFTCEDCHCQPKPWEAAANQLRGHMSARRGEGGS